MKKLLFYSLCLFLILVGIIYNNQKLIHRSPAQAFNKGLHSHSDPNSIWVVVNKKLPLQPSDYSPTDLVVPRVALGLPASGGFMSLRRPAAVALEQMATAAIKDGAHLMIASGYRSYRSQVVVYDSEVHGYGQAYADRDSARPGHSEHQTGLAVDLEPTSRQCEIADCFATTKEGKWLTIHAADYGFIQRYTADKIFVTGYRAEAWHFRYVGADLASELKKQSTTTLEEFFNLPAAANYDS